MRKVLLAGLVALLAPAAAHAQYQVGLRVGYGSATGDALQVKNAPEAVKMSDTFASQVPLQLDASYKINKDFAAGLYLSYGFVQMNKDQICGGASDCSVSGSTLGVGAQGIYTFNQVTGPFVPWAGLSLGYESASFKAEGATTTASGFQLGLQVGGDYKVNEQFSVGPYLSYAMGEYTSLSVSEGTAPEFDAKLHGWLGIGVLAKANF
jgi:hypothetical protein